MYDPKFSVKQMYDQYGSSRTKKADPKPSRSSGFGGMGPDPAERFGGSPTRGLGSKPTVTFGTDDSSGADNNPNRDAAESMGVVKKVLDRAVTRFRNFGASEPEDVIVDGKRVYKGPLFRGFDPTTSIGDFGGESGKKQYLLGMPILGEVTRSPAPPTLPPADTNPTLNMFGVTRSFARDPSPFLPPDPMVQPETGINTYAEMKKSIDKTLEGVVSVDYTIKRGDTLSEIAQDRGTTVDVLLKMNDIKEEDKDTIFAGEKLKVPPKKAKTYKDVVDDLYASSDQIMSDAYDPDSQYYQSTVPDKDRTYDEGDYLDNNPQTRQGLMVPQGQQNQPNAVIVEAQQALTNLGYRPMGVDGKIGGGTRRAVRKFQKAAGLPITGKLDKETITRLAAANAPKYFDSPLSASETKKILDSESSTGSILETFSKSDFDKFAAAVADKESSNRYNIKGGYNDGYDGKYQLGKGAKADVKAELTSEAEKNKMDHSDSKQRKAFRKDKKLQEKAFKIYTQKNHEHLTRYSKAYRDMSDKDKLAVLGYAHNQGATAAEEWLYTGVSGSDGFGTKGDEYTSLVKDALGERDTPN